MNEIKISVVVPCYNVEEYIRRGLDSIIAQTMKQWQAILVDDGATDSTGKICDEYAEKDCRFQVVHTQNQGLPCARNNGLKYVSGELVYFMDPDDKISPNCFELCYATYMKHPCDIVHFGFWWCYEGREKFTEGKTMFAISEGNDIYKRYTCPISGFGQEALNQYYQGEYIWNVRDNGGVWTYMFKSDFIIKNKLQFPPGVTMYEDGLFLVEATYKAQKIVEIPDVLYDYIQRKDSIVHKKMNSQNLYDYKFRHIIERRRLRDMIKEFDLHDSYLGTHVLSCLRLAVLTSDEWKNYRLFKRYVTHPDIQESIKKVQLKSAPLKFAVPVRLLKLHGQFLLFSVCWLSNKIGINLPKS